MESTKQNQNLTKMLVAMVAVLAVILAVVIGIAISTHIGGKTPQNGDSSSQDAPQNDLSHVELSVTPDFQQGKVTVAETAVFEGVSDPGQSLTVNGVAVERQSDGTFTCSVPLEVGKNTIVFDHKGKQETFEVERRYAIQFFSPADGGSYGSGATVRFEVSAREGSEVTVSFNGKTITLEKADNQQGNGVAEDFALYTGAYTLPTGNTQDKDLGAATFTVVCDGKTEQVTTGSIVCQKPAQILASNPGVTPPYGDYINVGSGYIAEIVIDTAETFDGKTTDDYSHPTNNYLPKGTVDYCSTQLVEVGKLQYIQLRCGRRVYVDKRNIPVTQRTDVADCYVGTLPDHNEIEVVSMQQAGNHTVLTLDCLWKAPFYFDILPQRYSNPDGGSGRSYEIADFTATHIDITLCYTTEFTGQVQISEDNPLFKSTEVIQNASDCILRLHLKKTGGFYGWDSYYNEEGQLCFEFLNPAKVTAADNAYGADLAGVHIMIDVGHGGYDGGTTGTDAEGNRWSESGRNMDLAYALRTELEKMGATVTFNREGAVTITADERISILKNAKPDLCVAVHHNSLGAGYEYYNGFETFYYTPTSMLVTKQVYERTKAAGIYNSSEMRWSNYYVARQTVCPVVLTENGYMTNQSDLSGTLDPVVIQKKAVAIAQGVADYFLLINK